MAFGLTEILSIASVGTELYGLTGKNKANKSQVSALNNQANDARLEASFIDDEASRIDRQASIFNIQGNQVENLLINNYERTSATLRNNLSSSGTDQNFGSGEALRNYGLNNIRADVANNKFNTDTRVENTRATADATRNRAESVRRGASATNRLASATKSANRLSLFGDFVESGSRLYNIIGEI